MLAVAVIVAPILVLGIEVQLARTAPRLEDEVGFRPTGLAVRPGAHPTRVMWLGDSTSTGVGADDVEHSMAYRVTDAVASGPTTLTIAGMSGAQVHEVIDAQIPVVVEAAERGAPPDVVFVSIGANDVTALTRRPTFRSRYRSLVARISDAAPDAEIVLVGIPDMGTAPRIPVPLRQLTGVRASHLDGVIEDVARERELHHVDLAGRTSSTFSSDPERYFSADDFHPSADGHAVWAAAVVDSIGEAGR